MKKVTRKRRISMILLAACVLMSCFGAIPAFGAEAAQQSESEAIKSEDLAVLAATGIITAYDDGTYNLFENMTRADLAVQAVRMLGENESQLTNNTYYTDLPNYHWAAPSVEMLLSRGILSQDETFRPDEFVTASEVNKVMVSLAGYGELAEAKGGYPIGYDLVANQIGILDGVKQSGAEACKRIDVFQIMFNTMTVPLMEPTSFSADGTKYDVRDETLFSLYHDIYHIEETVSGVSGISVYEGIHTEKDEISVGKIRMKSAGISMPTEYLGHKVSCYYRQVKDKIPEAVHLHVLDNEITINADDIASFSNYTLVYYNESGNKKSITIPKDASVVRNGEIISKNISDAFDVDYGTIKLIDDGNGYNTVIIREVETVICGTNDRINKLVYGDSTENPIHVSETERIVNIYQDSGLEMSADSITKGSLLSVVRSNVYTEICVSTRAISVTIDEVKSNGKNARYAVVEAEGEEYKILFDCYEESKEYVKPGNQVTFVLNMMGVVGAIEPATNQLDIQYGYVFQTAKTEGAFSDNIVLRMYTSSQEIKEYTLADSVVVDKTTYKMSRKADGTTLANKLDKPQLIVYSTNEKDEIKTIDTADVGTTEEESTLTRSLDWGIHRFVPWTMFQPLNFVNDSTIVISVPDESEYSEADVDDFNIQPIRTAITYQWARDYQCEAYRFDGTRFVDNVIVLDASMHPSLSMNDEWNYMFVVKDVLTTYDSKTEEIGIAVEAMDRSGATVVYNLYKDAQPIDQRAETGYRKVEAGDTVIAEFQVTGQISKMEILYDASEKEWLGTLNSGEVKRRGDYLANQRISMGYVKEIKDGYATWSYTPGAEVEEAGNLSVVSILVCRNDNGVMRMYKGTAEDLHAYEDVGGLCTKILAQANMCDVSTIIVYEE